jgi:hypothetical protein
VEVVIVEDRDAAGVLVADIVASHVRHAQGHVSALGAEEPRGYRRRGRD